MKIEIIALANYAEYSKDGKLSIDGIFDEIYAQAFPSSFVRGFLVFTISGGNPSTEKNLVVEVVGPDKKNILSQNVKVPFGLKGKGNYILELLSMPLPKDGDYEVSIKDGEEVIGRTKFAVTGVRQDEKGRARPTIN